MFASALFGVLSRKKYFVHDYLFKAVQIQYSSVSDSSSWQSWLELCLNITFVETVICTFANITFVETKALHARAVSYITVLKKHFSARPGSASQGMARSGKVGQGEEWPG